MLKCLEYKKVKEQEWYEKWIQEKMEEEKLTRKEAEILEYMPSDYDMFDKEAKRRGLTFLEVKKEYDERMEGPFLDECNYVSPGYADKLADEFIEDGKIEPDIFEHLNTCGYCNIAFFSALNRETGKNSEEVYKMTGLRMGGDILDENLASKRLITVEELRECRKQNMILCWGHGEGCFTMKERVVYAITCELPAERLTHARACIGCERMLSADREDFLITGRIGGLAMKERRESKTKKS